MSVVGYRGVHRNQLFSTLVWTQIPVLRVRMAPLYDLHLMTYSEKQLELSICGFGGHCANVIEVKSSSIVVINSSSFIKTHPKVQTSKRCTECWRQHIAHESSSKNFHVSAPSKRRIRTEANIPGSKLRRFTPWRVPGSGGRGSQCVTQPHVAQRMVLSVLSPWTYSRVLSGCPAIRTVPNS